MTEPSLTQESIFLRALEVPAGERAAFLDRVCGGSSSVRAEVEDLLRAHVRTGDLLDLPEAQSPTADQSTGECPGTVVGHYKLLQQIGEGGMGTVWMAEQTEPVRRKVAVKIVKAGADSRHVIARFEAERQALALMDHPNIARVHDAGASPGGRPYFVMELVKGKPITTYCDEHHLTPRERLELFVPVCQAIQHAHQKGIIHRDIKPSNVLVCQYDGRPVPKVIDFGVAKAAGPKLTDATLFTEFGQVVGTLEYMSPEQAELNQIDVDTRSDVYSLGVLLYELLTGTTPLGRKRLREAGFLEVLRLIREEEPPRPSTRLSTTAELPSIAANRRTEPRKLSGLVRGELDWIVMKALDKDRDRRYESANGLVHDIQRHLADEPVQACPPSAGYRFRKFARRNKRALATVSLIMVLLMGAVVLLAISNARTRSEYRRADAEARRAQGNLRLAFESMDEIYMQEVAARIPHDPDASKENEYLLKKGLEFYEQFARQNADDPRVAFEVAKAYHRAGQMHQSLGQYENAATHLKRAADVYGELIAADPNDLDAKFMLSVVYGDQAGLAADPGNNVQEAMRLRQLGIQLLEPLILDPSLHPKYQFQLAALFHSAGICNWDTGDHLQAEKNYRKAIELSVGLADRETDPQTKLMYLKDTSYYHADLSLVMRATGRPAEAADELRLTIAVLTQVHDQASTIDGYRRGTLPKFRRTTSIHRDLGSAHNNLANVLKDRGQSEAAIKEFGRSIDYYNQAIKDWPRLVDVATGLAVIERGLGNILVDKKDYAEAATHYRRSMELLGQLQKDTNDAANANSELGETYQRMGDGLMAGGDQTMAASYYGKALKLMETVLAQNPKNPAARNTLAWFLAACPDSHFRDRRRAVMLAESAVKMTREENGDFLNTLGVARYRNGEMRAAIGSLEKAKQLRREGDASDWVFLAMAQWRLGDTDLACLCYDRAVELLAGFEYIPEEDGRFLLEAKQLMGIKE
jgi:serine/threonine protein kinase/tetratricopeptide (TPR) repeat protein